MYGEPVPEVEAEETGLTTRGVVGGTKLFNRFTLQKVLGRGGMGIVWLARDDRLDRLVALKLVPEAVSFDASAQEDLKRERRKSLMLTHPNIVRIFDFIEDERTAAISMEYVDGATLSSLRVRKPSKCFDIGDISPWVTSLCDALAYAHDSARLIHRDLKPTNLMVNSRMELKITDFGIACSLRESMSSISVSTSSGTLNYMSPQQMLGEDPSASDDIYAVGATLYEMLSSKPPFYGGDVASQVREVIAPTIAQRREKLGITGEPIPKYWEETIAGCLAKNPERRPQSPADIARRLRLNGTIRLSDAHQKRRQTIRIDARIAAMAGGVLALIAAATLIFHHAKPEATVSKIVKEPAAPVGYAIEIPTVIAKPAKPAIHRAENVARAIPVAPEPTSTPAVMTEAGNATLQLTTTPPGATFSVFPGVIAGKVTPDVAPLRSGQTPDSIDDLPPGRYTLFFHNDGWPDDRTEISVGPDEIVPVVYSFPHGSATVTSTPDGAEIFLGTHSLGCAPLTVDLPLGKQKLVARLPDMPERTQTITIGNTAVNTAFQMRARSRSSTAKATPTPSALDKIGQSLKNVFGHKTPPPRRKPSSD
jgi:hypothetical protein